MIDWSSLVKNMPRKYVLLPLGLLQVPVIAHAAEIHSMSSMLGKTLWALFIVIGLILILYALVRKKIGYGSTGSNNIKVIEIKPIVPKNTLALIEVQGKELLIGISSNGMHLLADLSSPAKDRQFQEVLKEKQCGIK